MGAKKDKDMKILNHKVKKFARKAQKMGEYGISEYKIAKIEEKQERYEAWLEEVEAMNDY